MARRTSYDPSYCEQVIAWGREGKSKAWMASRLDVARQTVDNWCSEFPEFLDAMTRARDLAQAWWEDIGQNNIVSAAGVSLNSGVYSRSMAARFPDDWREKTETAITGRLVHANELPDDELARIAAGGGT
jgi:DNA-binding XRE family transcriptional regulator